jgi:hypothetical protein
MVLHMQQNEPTPWESVPIELAALLRPRLSATVDEIIAAVRAEVPEYDQPLEGEFGRLISEGVAVALDQFADLLGTDTAQPDTGIYAAMGRAELEAGRTLDALQSAYRTGARVAWRRVVADAGDRLEPAVMYVVAEAIFAYIDRLAAASVAAYAEALSAREGFAQARRHALIELLAAGPLADLEPLEERARAAGWEVPLQLAAVAIGDADPVALARHAPDGTIGATLDAGALLLVPDPDGPGRRRPLRSALARARGAVIGPTVTPARAHVSVQRALSGRRLQATGRFGEQAIVRADDHLLALLLAGDPALSNDLVARRLGPLESLARGARERALSTLRAWLAAHGDVSVAAETLHVHPQTVRYRLAQLRELLGDTLDDPVARLELALALRALAVRADPAAEPVDADEGASGLRLEGQLVGVGAAALVAVAVELLERDGVADHRGKRTAEAPDQQRLLAGDQRRGQRADRGRVALGEVHRKADVAVARDPGNALVLEDDAVDPALGAGGGIRPRHQLRAAEPALGVVGVAGPGAIAGDAVAQQAGRPGQRRAVEGHLRPGRPLAHPAGARAMTVDRRAGVERGALMPDAADRVDREGAALGGAVSGGRCAAGQRSSQQRAGHDGGERERAHGVHGPPTVGMRTSYALATIRCGPWS